MVLHSAETRIGTQVDQMTKPPLIASPRWMPEDDDRLRRLAQEGRSTAVIAERLKRGEDAVRSRAARLRIALKRVAKRKWGG